MNRYPFQDDSILVSWKLPEEPNGDVVQYTVYIQELDRSRDTAPKSHKVNYLQTSHQVDNLNRKSRYEFWVTAHTRIGEGTPSIRVTLSPTNRRVQNGMGIYPRNFIMRLIVKLN